MTRSRRIPTPVRDLGAILFVALATFVIVGIPTWIILWLWDVNPK